MNKKGEPEQKWEDVDKGKKELDKENKKKPINTAEINIPIRDSEKIKQRTFSITEKHIDMLSAMKIMSQVQENKDKNLSDLIMEALDLLWENEYQEQEDENGDEEVEGKDKKKDS